MSVDESEYVTAEYVARMLVLERRTIYRWVDIGHLPAIKLGTGRRSSVRIKRSDLAAFLENARRDPTPVEPEPVRPGRKPRRQSRIPVA